jgi:hypothetical protein
MTNRQIYQALARMAAHRCYDGKKFLVSKRIGGDHLESVQNQMLVLMQKVSYERTLGDFGHAMMERMRERARSEQNIAQVPPSLYTGIPAMPDFSPIANIVDRFSDDVNSLSNELNGQ